MGASKAANLTMSAASTAAIVRGIVACVKIPSQLIQPSAHDTAAVSYQGYFLEEVEEIFPLLVTPPPPPPFFPLTLSPPPPPLSFPSPCHPPPPLSFPSPCHSLPFLSPHLVTPPPLSFPSPCHSLPFPSSSPCIYT